MSVAAKYVSATYAALLAASSMPGRNRECYDGRDRSWKNAVDWQYRALASVNYRRGSCKIAALGLALVRGRESDIPG